MTLENEHEVMQANINSTGVSIAKGYSLLSRFTDIVDIKNKLPVIH